ncbi:MAG: hypothetical protein AAF192_01430 [Pseudomonadota bacterium]
MTTGFGSGRGSSRRGYGDDAAFFAAVQRMLEAQKDCQVYVRERDRAAANDNRQEKPEGPDTPSQAA